MFETDTVQDDLGTSLKELHLKHTKEELMAMIDKPALLAELMTGA